MEPPEATGDDGAPGNFATHGGVAATRIDTVNNNPTFVSLSLNDAVLRLVRPGAEDRARARTLRELARRVRSERAAFISQALGVDRGEPAEVRFANPDPVSSGAVADLLVRWYPVDGGPAGATSQVADFYRHETEGRLAVLGAPGSGKTVLLSLLVHDLIAALPGYADPRSVADAGDGGWVVPVLMSLPTCDLGDVGATPASVLAEQMDRWIAGSLAADYQIPVKTAVGLLADGHILPVLDGLDEMDSPSSAGDEPGASRTVRPRAAAAVKALNHDRTRPVVLACRNLDYADLVRAADDGVPNGPHPPIVGHARHVTLQPMTADEVADYLARRFTTAQRSTAPRGTTSSPTVLGPAEAGSSAAAGVSGTGPALGPVLEDRWRPVVDAIRSGHPLSGVLASPLQLFLVVTAYAHRDTRPAVLLELSPEQVRDNLFGSLVPAVVRYDEHAAGQGWTAQQVRAWLSQIAEHQSRQAARGRSLVDIHLPDLWRISGRLFPRLVPALAVFLLVIPVAVSSAAFGGWFGGVSGAALVACAVVFGVGVWDESAPLSRADLSSLRTRAGRRKLVQRLAANVPWGSAAALGFGLLTGLAFEPAVGLVAGTTIGVTLWLGFTLQEWMQVSVEYAPSSATLVRQCLSYSVLTAVIWMWGLALTVGLIGSLAGGQPVGSSGSLTSGLSTASSIGIAVALAIGRGAVWLRYGLGVRSAAHQRRLPRRPALFLDWCVTAGLMRMAGSSIQFRHREFQHWLTATAAVSPDALEADPT
ncbi:hypothetical protein [Cellulomonas sp. URHB0016]